MSNLCGTCTVCCSRFWINKDEMPWRDTDKQVGERCDKVAKNECSIYDSRPKPCKNFECLWLQVSVLSKLGCPVEWRPDNIDLLVVTTYNEFGDNKFTFKVEELTENIFDNTDPIVKEYVDRIFDLSLKQKSGGQVVLYKYGEDKGNLVTKR